MPRSYSYFDSVKTLAALKAWAADQAPAADAPALARWWGFEAPYGGERIVHDGLTCCECCSGRGFYLDYTRDEPAHVDCAACVDGFAAAGMEPRTFEPYAVRRARLDADRDMPF